MQNREEITNQQKLLNKIKTTRKARIHTEVRLLRYSFWTNFALIAYALASVTLALISSPCASSAPCIAPSSPLPSSEDLVFAKWASVAIAVALLPVSAVISTQRFGERAVLMRVCYTQLDLLRQKIKEGHPDLNAYADYQSILALTENHAEIDYLAGNSHGAAKQEHGKNLLTRGKEIRILWHNYGLPFIWFLIGGGAPALIVTVSLWKIWM